MSLKYLSSLTLIFVIGCSTPPIKYDKPIKSDDYKYFYKLKEESDNPVSKKSVGQKVKDAFKRKPKVNTVEVVPVKTNTVEIKKSRPLVPTRRTRKTNTSPITNEIPVLLANTRQGDLDVKSDTGKTIMLYLIYLQAIIIAIFAYAVLRRQKKTKNKIVKKGELNL